MQRDTRRHGPLARLAQRRLQAEFAAVHVQAVAAGRRGAGNRSWITGWITPAQPPPKKKKPLKINGL